MSDLVEQPPRSRQATRQLWAQRLARFPQTGLSVAAFCAAEAVSTNSFFYWKRQLIAPAPSTSDAAPRLLPVRVQPSSDPVEIVLPNGTVLRLAPGCDLAFVRSLLQALAGQPC